MQDVTPVFSGLQSVFNWSQDFIDALRRGLREQPRLAAVAVACCQQWLGQFTDEEEMVQFNFASALAAFQFHAGDADAGERALAGLAALWPHNPWSYITIADAWANMMPAPGLGRDDARAMAWLERGLVDADPRHRDRGVLVQRIEALRGRAVAS